MLDEDGLLQLTWLTPREAAAKVRVSVKTIYAWVADGRVRTLRDEGAPRNADRLWVEHDSLLECEVAMRKAKRGRPRAGTSRGRA